MLVQCRRSCGAAPREAFFNGQSSSEPYRAVHPTMSSTYAKMDAIRHGERAASQVADLDYVASAGDTRSWNREACTEGIVPMQHAITILQDSMHSQHRNIADSH